MNRKAQHAVVLLCVTAWCGSAAGQAIPRDFELPMPLFSASSPWNRRVEDVAVADGSDAQIQALYRVLLGDDTYLKPPGSGMPYAFPSIYVNHDEYSIPIFRMGKDAAGVVMRDYGGAASENNPKLPVEAGGTLSLPVPEGNVRPSGPQTLEADGHVVLYDPDNYVEYDYWQATTAVDASEKSLGGGREGAEILAAGAVDYFDVRATGINPDGASSARATGTPLLAGLLLPEDIERGVIEHALAFAIPGPRNTNTADSHAPYSSDYFPPASTTETDYYCTDPNALAAGQRIRVKRSLVDDEGNTLDEETLAPITQIFLDALRTYGAYCVDNSGGFTFYAEDIHTAVLNLGDDRVNALVGATPGTPLPGDKTKWHHVIDTLNNELDQIPLAYGSWKEGDDPSTATVTTANFEVVESVPRTLFPAPNISINGLDGFIRAEFFNRLSISVELDPGDYAGIAGDWWCAAVTPFGFYWYTLDEGWVWSFRPLRGYGGPLFDLAAYALPSLTDLPAGTYFLYFGIDLELNGRLDFSGAYYDLINVLIEGAGIESPLSWVKYWACQLKNLTEPGMIEELVNSDYDMVVIDPVRTDWTSDDRYFNTKAMVEAIKGTLASDGEHRKLALAHVDIGRAEERRWYWEWAKEKFFGIPWQGDWPDFILSFDPDGLSDRHSVAYWDNDWKDIIIYGDGWCDSGRDYCSVIDEVVNDGFDGVYLDWVEVFQDPAVITSALLNGKDPADEMVELIRDIREYALRRNPNFIIVQQNGAALLEGHRELLLLIDGIAQEGIWYEGEETDNWDDINGFDEAVDLALTAYYLGMLERYRVAGIPVFNIEYALSNASDAYARSLAEGFIPYCTRRALSALTTTPPPGY